MSVGFDEVHFNSGGYKIAAKDAYEELKSHMKAIEWNTFKARLVPQNADKNKQS